MRKDLFQFFRSEHRSLLVFRAFSLGFRFDFLDVKACVEEVTFGRRPVQKKLHRFDVPLPGCDTESLFVPREEPRLVHYLFNCFFTVAR